MSSSAVIFQQAGLPADRVHTKLKAFSLCWTDQKILCSDRCERCFCCATCLQAGHEQRHHSALKVRAHACVKAAAASRRPRPCSRRLCLLLLRLGARRCLISRPSNSAAIHRPKPNRPLDDVNQELPSPSAPLFLAVCTVCKDRFGMDAHCHHRNDSGNLALCCLVGYSVYASVALVVCSAIIIIINMPKFRIATTKAALN